MGRGAASRRPQQRLGDDPRLELGLVAERLVSQHSLSEDGTRLLQRPRARRTPPPTPSDLRSSLLWTETMRVAERLPERDVVGGAAGGPYPSLSEAAVECTDVVVLRALLDDARSGACSMPSPACGAPAAGGGLRRHHGHRSMRGLANRTSPSICSRAATGLARAPISRRSSRA